MSRRREQGERDLQQATEKTGASRRRADQDMEAARDEAVAADRLRDRLAAMNASNGFVELLVDAVVRGSR